MKYLISTVEKYRVETEPEAAALIEAAKHDGSFTLSKYSSQLKVKAATKKNDAEEWYCVTLHKEFNDEKDSEAATPVAIKYAVGEMDD